MEEFSKSIKKTDNEPILQQPEEESKGPAEGTTDSVSLQPAEGTTDSVPLPSSRSLCYTVAWFDGKVERFQSEVFSQFLQACNYY